MPTTFFGYGLDFIDEHGLTSSNGTTAVRRAGQASGIDSA
jgi:hypothetical protein